MLRWHGPKCRKPDVLLAGALPFCGNCDRTADLTLEVSQQAKPPAIPRSARSNLNLSWPSCISYSDRCILDEDDGEDLGPALVAQLQTEAPWHQNHGPTAVTPGDEINKSNRNAGAQAFVDLKSPDEIRLLHLKSGKWDEPLHGMLDTTSLKNHRLDYEAVSYVWAGEDGDTTRSAPLFVGDSWEILPITENCASALRRLRSSSRDRTLWIDAICINQDNILERSHQVGMMRTIYSMARRCLVYLGEHADESPLAMQLLELGVPEKLSPQNRDAIQSLFERKYFYRTWIFQELVSSPRVVVHCGDRTADWYNFFTQDWSKCSPEVRVPAWIQNFELARYRQALDFPRYVFETAESLASDDRDKVFAILGLFDGLEKQGLVADYELSTEQVYTGLAAYLIAHCAMYHLLTLQSLKNPSIPSWVPDWRFVKPSQWNSHEQSADEIDEKFPIIFWSWTRPFGRLSHEAQAFLQDLRFASQPHMDMTSDSNGVTGFDLGAERHTLMKDHVLKHVDMRPQVHRSTGGLSISVDFLVPLSDFTRGELNSFAAQMPFHGFLADQSKWLVVSTCEIDPGKDYLAVVPGNMLFLHLRQMSGPAVFRIVGHCNLYVVTVEYPGTRHTALQKTGSLVKSQREICTVLFQHSDPSHDPNGASLILPDIAGVWALQDWAGLLWDAFSWVNASLGFKGGPLSEDSGEAAQTLAEAYHIYKREGSRGTTPPSECGRLLRCIDLWSYDDPWEPMSFPNGLFGIKHRELTEAWKRWPVCRDRVLGKLEPLSLFVLDANMDAIIEELNSMDTEAAALVNAQDSVATSFLSAPDLFDSTTKEQRGNAIMPEPERVIASLRDTRECLAKIRLEIDILFDRNLNIVNHKAKEIDVTWGARWKAENYVATDHIKALVKELDSLLQGRQDAIVGTLDKACSRQCRKMLDGKRYSGVDLDLLASRYAKLAMELGSHKIASFARRVNMADIKTQCGEIGAILDFKLRMQQGARIVIV